MKNKKGFLMSEALVVSTVLLTALALIYSQFVTANAKISETKNYNTVENNYYASLVINYIQDYSYLNTIKNSSNWSNNILTVDNCISCTELQNFEQQVINPGDNVNSKLNIYFIDSDNINSATGSAALNKYITYIKPQVAANQYVVIVSKTQKGADFDLTRYGYGVINE